MPWILQVTKFGSKPTGNNSRICKYWNLPVKPAKLFIATINGYML